MNKEQLIKLAEVAGYEFRKATDKHSHSTYERFDQLVHSERIGLCVGTWQPHKDIAQAFEVLEGFDYSGMRMMKSVPILVSISKCVRNDTHFLQEEYEAKGSSLPEAICKAVLKAVDYE